MWHLWIIKKKWSKNWFEAWLPKDCNGVRIPWLFKNSLKFLKFLLVVKFWWCLKNYLSILIVIWHIWKAFRTIRGKLNWGLHWNERISNFWLWCLPFVINKANKSCVRLTTSIIGFWYILCHFRHNTGHEWRKCLV